MKKFQVLASLLIVPVLSLLLNGCILDAFNEIVQNLSIERSFTVSGNSSGIVDQNGTFSLNDSQLYKDNKDKIKKMRYRAASFCVSQNSTPSLQGNIILTLKTATGVQLFTKTLTAFKPNDYLGIQAMDLPLTQTEIDLVNAYLSNIDQLSSVYLIAGLKVQNVTPANTQVSMKCFISLAIEMTIEP